MSMKHYLAARKEGLKQQHAAQARGQDPYLPVLSELVPTLNKLTQVPLGLVQIALDQIEGTATKGRTTAFSRGFMPLLEPDSEFASKWSVLYDGIVEDGLRQPIVALEYYNRFYIVEGNKRVSVMRRLDAVSIEADVTRVLPEPEDSERYRVYQEFLSFYADTKINFITFTREGSYEKLYKLMGKTPGKKWSPEDLFDFQSCFYRFQQAYSAKAEGSAPMPACDALLIYLEVFGYEDSVEKTPAEFGQEIERIWSEFVVAAANKPAALLSQPTEAKPGFLQSVWHKPPQTVRCAFLYNRSPQDSGWSYWHELGRKALEDTFGSRVETVCRECVAQEDAQEVIERFIEDGYDVIFAASPVFLDACIRQCAIHPNAKILNCSLLASYHNVRSYYLRVYEAKFVLGAIAAALSESDEIGYIADYPIYGTPTSINAFALGAQMVNPRAQIVLEWSTLPGHSPEAALAARGVHIISSRDISAPHLESRAFGLYHEQDGVIANLAMPIWNWGKLYEGIVRSILTGAWSDEGEHNADRAMKVLDDLRAAIPGVQFTCDVIVGFPGETEEDFAETLDFMRRARFLAAHVFPYSPRRGTPAAVMPGQIPEPEKHRRAAVLSDLERGIRKEILDDAVNNSPMTSVLFETFDGATAVGHTGSFIEGRVPATENPHGRLLPVRLTGTAEDPSFEYGSVCLGKMIEEENR